MFCIVEPHWISTGQRNYQFGIQNIWLTSDFYWAQYEQYSYSLNMSNEYVSPKKKIPTMWCVRYLFNNVFQTIPSLSIISCFIIYLHLHRGLEAVNPPLVYSQSYGPNVHQSSRPYVVVSGNKVVVHFWFQLHTGWDSPSSNIQAKLEYSMPT